MQPNDPDAQVSLGNALYEKKRTAEAIAHYEQALAMRPDYFFARYGLGRALLENGQIDAAISQCRAALLIRPEDPDCQTVLAVALEERGETAEAIQHYQKAVQNSAQAIPALTNLSWILATSSNPALHDGNKAVELAGYANQLTAGSNPTVLRTLAAAYAEVGQFGKAIETARTAIRHARLSGDNSLTTDLDQQIALYQLGLPYREAK
jgi:tetratricopeptide (TPR) repeat protein